MSSASDRSSVRRWVVPVVLCLATALASTWAHAQPSAADKETARNLMIQGNERYEAKDFAAALKAYSAANDIMHVPSTSVAVALAHAELGQLVEARDQALEAARYPKRDSEPEAFQNAREEAAALADKLALRIPSLQVTVQGVRPGVAPDVRIDDVSVPYTAVGLSRRVNPGVHRLVVSAPGYEDASAPIQLQETEKRTITIALKPMSPPVASAPVPAASQRPAPSPGTSPIVYVGLAVGAAGIITGSVTGLVAFSKATDIKQDCDGNACPQSREADANSAKSIAATSTVAFGVGAAGLGVALVGWLASRGTSGAQSTASIPTPRMVPLIGVGQAGMSCLF
jgi:hypothetical protein